MARGYQTAGDVLVNQTADGIDLNTVFEEIQAALSLWNSERSTIAGLLSFKTTTMGDAIPQGTTDSFELASEFGVPHATSGPTALKLGYTFNDYDLRTGALTWKYLRDATAAQVKSVINTGLDADARLCAVSLLKRLFDPTQETNDFGVPAYGVYNADGMVPPPALGRVFPGSTNHALPTGAATIDSDDIEGLAKLVTDKNYGTTPGSKLLILANPQEGDAIQGWRAGEESRSGGPKSRWSFIPSAAAPPYLTTETLVGERAPEKWNGVQVAGSLGPMWLIQSNFIPAGYVAVVASSGLNSANNVIGFREHANAAYRGLRQIPGNGPYPLVDAFMQRSFGTGVRRRGAAAVCQVTTESTYTAPTFAL